MQQTVSLQLEINAGNEFRIIPSGQFSAYDGRPGYGKYWNLSYERGQTIIAEAAIRQSDYLIDYDHGTLNGGKKTAAGWFKNLAWRDDGLYVINAQWTDEAKRLILAREYRYVSPVFRFDKDTFEVLGLVNVAITNSPALLGLTDLSKVAINHMQKSVCNDSLEEVDMNTRASLEHAFGRSWDEIKRSIREEEAAKPQGISESDRAKLEWMFGRPLEE